MSWLGAVGQGIGLVGSIYGLLSAEREKREAMAAQQAAIRQYQLASDEAYQNALTQGARSLYSATGYGVDALQQLGGSMGSALAAGGVYNPSAVGGALAAGQRNVGMNLAQLAADNLARAQQIRTQGLQDVARLQLGAAGNYPGQTGQNVANAAAGLGSFLGSLGTLLPKKKTTTDGGGGGGGGTRMTQAQSNAAARKAFETAGWLPPSKSYRSAGQESFNSAVGRAFGASPASQVGTTTQQNLALTGANTMRMGLPMMNGTINQAPNLWGNALPMQSNVYTGQQMPYGGLWRQQSLHPYGVSPIRSAYGR